MRKVILMMLLAVMSGSAAAEWVEVGRSETHTSYADLATIRTAGNLVKMWGLLDLKTPELVEQSKPFMSMMSQTEHDCKEERTRRLSLIMYSGNMGMGEVIFTDSDPGKWSPVAPGSVQEHLWELACGKR
jgi:hypothetical protein